RRIADAERFRRKTSEFIKDLNERIKEHCADLMVPCVDLYKALGSPDRPDLLDPEFAIGDNAHLNLEGQKRMAKAFHEEYFKEAEFDIVVCIGDSHTQGFPVRDDSRNLLPIELDIDSPHQYPYWLAKWTRKTFMNAGVAGNTLYGMRNRFESDVLPYFPDHCCIQGGTNDSLLGISPEESLEDMLALIEKCLEAEITPVVGTIPPLGF
ncbi:MAG: hypothetical protein JW939_01485, partial [Candidatus Thermoplasmatota archaeon]|nr:hypothetical protein [Candidatus Thermoplasmatota archaeon]